MIRTMFKHLALALVLAAGAAPALAQQTTAFTYQGLLKSDGQPVNGTVDLRFDLFDALTGGTPITSSPTFFDVNVTEGIFTTEVDLGGANFAGDQPRYLEVSVRGPAGSGPFVTLGSRQRFTTAPYSLATRGITVDSSNQVGIGTTTPQSRLHVVGNGFTTGAEAPYGIFETLADPSPFNQFGPQLRLRHGGPGGQDWVMVSTGAGNGGAGKFLILRSGSPIVPLTLSETDNVGIGTATPRQRLDVIGNALVSGNLGVGTAAPSRMLDVRADGYGIAHKNTAGTSDLTTFIDTGVGSIGTVSNTRLSLFTNDSTKLTILPNGNVGIGTITPTEKLEVRSNGNGITHKSLDGLVDLTTFIDAERGAIGTVADKPLQFFTNNTGRVIISRYGEVGIGTVVPSRPLDVHADGYGITHTSVTGDNNITTYVDTFVASIGTTTNSRLSLFTDDVTRMSILANGNVGIGTITPSQRLAVAGNIVATGSITPSCAKLKKNVVPINDALQQLSKLDAVRFDWIEAEANTRGFTHDLGFIAEDVAKTFPEVVFRDENGEVMGLDYSRMSAVAVGAIKELKRENDELKARVERLEAFITSQADRSK